MRLVATLAATLVKLAFAASILALGWMVFSPASTDRWPLAPVIEPWIVRVISALPVDRVWWGVLVLALGVGAMMAALPKKAAARSRKKPPLMLAFDAEDLPIPVPVAHAVHEEAVLTPAEALADEAATPEALQPIEAEVTPVLDQTSGAAPWEFSSSRESAPPAEIGHKASPVSLALDPGVSQRLDVSQDAQIA